MRILIISKAVSKNMNSCAAENQLTSLTYFLCFSKTLFRVGGFLLYLGNVQYSDQWGISITK